MFRQTNGGLKQALSTHIVDPPPPPFANYIWLVFYCVTETKWTLGKHFRLYSQTESRIKEDHEGSVRSLRHVSLNWYHFWVIPASRPPLCPLQASMRMGRGLALCVRACVYLVITLFNLDHSVWPFKLKPSWLFVLILLTFILLFVFVVANFARCRTKLIAIYC